MMADADLDILGRDEFWKIAGNYAWSWPRWATFIAMSPGLVRS